MNERNAAVVQGLRELADYIEAHPGLPELHYISARRFCHGRDELRDAIQAMGSCEKKYDDNYVTAKADFSGGVTLEYHVDREAVCKKIITWDCGDAALLKELGLEEVTK